MIRLGKKNEPIYISWGSPYLKPKDRLKYWGRMLTGIFLYPFDNWNKEDEEAYQYALNILKNATKDELLDYDSRMNEWQWCFSEYGFYYKKLSDSGQRRKNKSTILIKLMNYIKITLGQKTILKHHNKNRMTDDEFEDFYDRISKESPSYYTCNY